MYQVNAIQEAPRKVTNRVYSGYLTKERAKEKVNELVKEDVGCDLAEAMDNNCTVNVDWEGNADYESVITVDDHNTAVMYKYVIEEE